MVYNFPHLNCFWFLLIFCSVLQFIGYGTEESILVLQTCFDQLNFQWKDYKNIQLEPIFVSTFRNILNRPNFSTLLCQSIKSLSVNEDLLDSLCKAMQLAASERIVLGLALSESENADVRMCGMSHLISIYKKRDMLYNADTVFNSSSILFSFNVFCLFNK